jgi:VWFA-related protein
MRTRFLLVPLLGYLSLTTFAQQPQQPAAAQTADQQPPITFKVEVNYVEVDAVVTDSAGRFVRGLTREDFEVREQSKPQTISVFSLVDIPVERPDTPYFAKTSIEPDVRTNREIDGRVFVLVLDDLHTQSLRSPRVRAAARQFVERYLGENDIAAVVTTGGSKSTAQNFTSSRRLLLKAIDAFMGQKLRSSTLEQLAQLPSPAPGMNRRADPLSSERAYKARASLGTLKGVAEYMEGIRGRRKAVVFFSEGIDYDMSNPIQNEFANDVRSLAGECELLRGRSTRLVGIRRRDRDPVAARRQLARPPYHARRDPRCAGFPAFAGGGNRWFCRHQSQRLSRDVCAHHRR